MKQVLVIGGAGFIGSSLCRKLLEDGFGVVAIDNLITSSGENIKQLSKNPKFSFIKHDITKPFPSKLISQLKNVKSFYHLACPTGVPNLEKLGEEMLLTCSIGSQNILNFAKKQDARVLFTSSSEVYGDPEVFPQSEEYNGNVNPIGIRSSYEEGKRFSEALISLYVRKYNLDAVIVRVFNTYGSNAMDGETRVIPKLLKLAKANKLLPVEEGWQTRTFCYIDDLVNGLILLMSKGKKGEVYNLGGREEITINNLAKTILKITGSKSKIKYVPRPTHDHKRRLPNLSKIKSLGWRQKITLEEGLRKIAL